MIKVKNYNFAKEVLECKNCLVSKDVIKLCGWHNAILQNTDWLDEESFISLTGYLRKQRL